MLSGTMLEVMMKNLWNSRLGEELAKELGERNRIPRATLRFIYKWGTVYELSNGTATLDNSLPRRRNRLLIAKGVSWLAEVWIITPLDCPGTPDNLTLDNHGETFMLVTSQERHKGCMIEGENRRCSRALGRYEHRAYGLPGI